MGNKSLSLTSAKLRNVLLAALLPLYLSSCSLSDAVLVFFVLGTCSDLAQQGQLQAHGYGSESECSTERFNGLVSLLRKFGLFEFELSVMEKSNRGTKQASVEPSREHELWWIITADEFSTPALNSVFNSFLDLITDKGYIAVKTSNDVSVSMANARLTVNYYDAPSGVSEAGLATIYDEGRQNEILDPAKFNSFQIPAEVLTTGPLIRALELKAPSGALSSWTVFSFRNSDYSGLPEAADSFILQPGIRLEMDLQHSYTNIHEVSLAYLIGVGGLEIGPVSTQISENASRPAVFFFPNLAQNFIAESDQLEYSNILCNCTGVDLNVNLSAQAPPWQLGSFEFYNSGGMIDAAAYSLSASNSCPDNAKYRCDGCSCEELTVKSANPVGSQSQPGYLSFRVQDQQDAGLSAEAQSAFVETAGGAFYPYLVMNQSAGSLNFSWRGLDAVSYTALYASDAQSPIQQLPLGSTLSHGVSASGFPELFIAVQACDAGDNCSVSNIIAAP